MRTQGFQKVRFSALVLIVALTVSLSAMAQGNGIHSNGSGATIHGNPPSVTSFGFGGQRGFHGVPASVTSLNFGNAPLRINHGTHQPQFFAPRRHRDRGFVSPFYGNVVAVPYAYPVYVTDTGVDDSMEMEEEDYRGGPTLFDRRGPGTSESSRPQREYRVERNQNENEEDYRTATPPVPTPQAEVSNQPSTVLVFKDGRRLEIQNYAIVGSTLYDLSNGLTRKVTLAGLDLPATVKQNDDRGVDFQLPAGAQLN